MEEVLIRPKIIDLQDGRQGETTLDAGWLAEEMSRAPIGGRSPRLTAGPRQIGPMPPADVGVLIAQTSEFVAGVHAGHDSPLRIAEEKSIVCSNILTKSPTRKCLSPLDGDVLGVVNGDACALAASTTAETADEMCADGAVTVVTDTTSVPRPRPRTPCEPAAYCRARIPAGRARPTMRRIRRSGPWRRP